MKGNQMITPQEIVGVILSALRSFDLSPEELETGFGLDGFLKLRFKADRGGRKPLRRRGEKTIKGKRGEEEKGKRGERILNAFIEGKIKKIVVLIEPPISSGELIAGIKRGKVLVDLPSQVLREEGRKRHED